MKGTDQKRLHPSRHREADKIVASIDAPDIRPIDARSRPHAGGRDLLAHASELILVTAESIVFQM
jgi:hypothetical protein